MIDFSILKKCMFSGLLSALGWAYAQPVASPPAKPSDRKFYAEVQAIRARDLASPPPLNPIVFAGSSSFRMWTKLHKDMRRLPVVNNGFGGSTFPDLMEYLDELILSYTPSAVFIYEGDNDLSNPGVSPEMVADRLRACYEALQARMPRLRVYVVSVKPSPVRQAILSRAQFANELMAGLARELPFLEFIDTMGPMLTPDGGIRENLFLEDRLHMNRKGYRIWKKTVYPHAKAAFEAAQAAKL